MLIIQQQLDQVIDEAVSNLGVEYLSSLPIFVSFTLSDCCKKFIYNLKFKNFTFLFEFH